MADVREQSGKRLFEENYQRGVPRPWIAGYETHEAAVRSPPVGLSASLLKEVYLTGHRGLIRYVFTLQDLYNIPQRDPLVQAIHAYSVRDPGRGKRH